MFTYVGTKDLIEKYGHNFGPSLLVHDVVIEFRAELCFECTFKNHLASKIY